MRSAAKTVTFKRTLLLKQPEVGNLIRELRRLTQLTQEQFAAVLGVTFGTINRWENGRMQPSPLALRQIQSVLNELSHSSEETLRNQSKQLLKKYFAGEEEGL